MQYELETAKALKVLRPDIKVLVSRNTEAAAYFWDSCRERMTDPKTQDYFTQCRGKDLVQNIDRVAAPHPADAGPPSPPHNRTCATTPGSIWKSTDNDKIASYRTFTGRPASRPLRARGTVI